MTDWLILLTAVAGFLALARRAQRVSREEHERARYREMRQALRESLLDRSGR